jgi:KaiC/GvpD/RAD55 family RecA-like ATPase
MKVEIRTFISPVIIGGDLGDKAGVEFLNDGQPVCWLDCLLGGGIQIPEGITTRNERPLLWVITGPHGSGKSVLGMELCFRVASREQPKPTPPEPAGRHLRTLGKKLNSILYSRESSSGRIKENMQSFGWDIDKAAFTMRVIGNDVLAQRGAEPRTMFQEVCTEEGLKDADGTEGFVVVLDGLGSFMEKRDIVMLLDEILLTSSGRIWLLVLILDLKEKVDSTDTLADRADILTKFSENFDGDYCLRNIRIVKMRFQEHVQGQHIVKVYGRPPQRPLAQRMPAGDHIGLPRKEGGLYVLPSIHRHLSGGMRIPPKQTNHQSLDPVVENLNQILPLGTGDLRGFPKGGCTAFVGVRGGMKSYLAYLTMLKHLFTDHNALGIMLSLRDDEQGALLSLRTICELEGIGSNEWLKDVTSNKTRRLLVEYFWPGYIPPSEFMHRVVVATEGMLSFHKGANGQNLFVVLNGLDHLTARHPLCAREEMFVPAIISYFKQHSSSIFVVAATEPESARSLAGLEPMADCLLKFGIPGSIPPGIDITRSNQFIEVLAQRVPAGGIGHGRGILYRYDSPHDESGSSRRKGQLLFHKLGGPDVDNKVKSAS